MKYTRKAILILIAMFTIFTTLTASDWFGSFSVRGGRTDAECDIESPWKTLFMFGASFELWYKDFISIGPYVHFTQLHSGPLDASIHSGTWNYPEHANFRTYIAGVDLKARLRPKVDWMNIRFRDKFIDRIAPYVDGGIGIITFDPQDREGTDIEGWDVVDGVPAPHSFERHAGVFPVWGGGLTFFSRLGVSADLGIDFHQVNSDFLDGVRDNDDNDAFWTGYVALALISTRKIPAPEVRIPREPDIIVLPEPVLDFAAQLDVTPPLQNVPHSAGTTEFDVTSNVSWVTYEGEAWLTVAPNVGVANDKLTVSYDANPANTPRTGIINVSGGGITKSVTVVQSAAMLEVTPSIQDVPFQAGIATFTVDSNVAWTVSEDIDWFTVSPADGNNDGTLTVSYQANPKTARRMGQFTVSGGGIIRTVNVIQAPKKIEFKEMFDLVIEGVNFKTDKADLTEGAKKILDEVVTALKEFPEVTLEIQGHTDSDASEAYNMDLSRRRSISVKNYLVEHGIAAARLTTSWFGESRPIDTNATPAGKARNRRIEFIRTDQ